MTGLPYDEELDNYPWVKAPISTEQRQNHSSPPLPTNMDIDDLPKPEADKDVNMVDTVPEKPFVRNREDGDVQRRTSKTHGRNKSRGTSRLGTSRSRSPLREALIIPAHNENANKSSDEKVIVPESDEQRQARIEETKAAANNDPAKPEDGDKDELGAALLAELENPTDEKASSPEPTESSTTAAMHLAKSREELNDERSKSSMTPVIAPDRESLIKQVSLLWEKTETLEQRLQGSNLVIVDQQREIQDLRRSLHEAKTWAEEKAVLETLYQKLKVRSEKLEDQLDEAIAREQAAVDKSQDLVKVIESMSDMQPNSLGLQQAFTHESQSVASDISSVLHAPSKESETREYPSPSPNQQFPDKAVSAKVTDKSPKDPEQRSSKKVATNTSPKITQKTNKLEADLAAARHQLSGCHKNTRLHKRQIYELRNEVQALTDARRKDLQTIETLTEAQQADPKVIKDESEQLRGLTEQLTESKAQIARLELKGNAKDTLVRGLRETNDVLKDELTASRLEAKSLTATVEYITKNNRALTLAQSDPARYESKIAALTNALNEAKARELKLQESMNECLEKNKMMTAELDQLRKTRDEEAIYRNRAIARKNENADLRATAVPRAELTAVEAENVRLEKDNADLIAERNELIDALDYAREKIETISRSGPPATLSQQRTMYANAVAGVAGRSERAKAVREVKQILAEQREESFRSMRLAVWNMEEEWKAKFGMAGPYCKDIGSRALPMGDRSMLRSVATAV
ncbi:hypothetical protein MBLNU457_5433t1 [Dothideomycetes sp. NU457]